MTVAQRVMAFQQGIEPFLRFFNESTYMRRHLEPDIADFVLGNPHEMPLTAVVEALQRAVVPQNKDWFAYKNSEPSSQAAIAASLRQWRQLPFEAEDISMTTGAFAGIAVVLNALVDPGDEVIFNSPPWFFYEGLIAAAGGIARRVKVRQDTFDLDLDEIQAALTPRTRAIIVNSPNNPTGRIYPAATLKALAEILDAASNRIGHPIYILSDEAYSRIIYDGRPYPSPTAFYPNTFLIYTYGKTLLIPGQRLGYIALPPTLPDRAMMRQVLFATQVFTGYAFPNALLQHALADLEAACLDVAHLQRKRDRVVSGLRETGYEVTNPEGTFYVMARSPIPDDWAFIERLAENKVFCLPGSVVELPGYFRISLTANDAMIDKGLPGFKAAMAKA
jgi:aspartate aminotransferase